MFVGAFGLRLGSASAALWKGARRFSFLVAKAPTRSRCGRERVEPRDDTGVVERYEASGPPALHVLQREFSEIAIEDVDTRAKRGAVVLAAQSFGD